VLEIPRSGLKALLHNQDAEFEYATLSFGCESTQGSILLSHVSGIDGTYGRPSETS
jgi:hypothetical protein